MRKKASIGAILAILTALGYGGYTLIKKSDLKILKGDGRDLYVVEKVIDGDTIRVDNGERVRLIGINSPEKGECFYNESKDELKRLIEDKKVRLEKDISGIDEYGRLLRYVILPNPSEYEDDLLINNYLVREGFVLTFASPPNNRYWDLLVTSREKAIRENKGIWKECDYEASNSSTMPQEDSKPKEDCVIKGNISDRGFGKIYFVPGCINYNRVKIDLKRGEKWFCTEEEAKEAGFRKATNCP